VPEAVRSAHVREAEALDEVARVALLLEDLDPLPGAHDAQVGTLGPQPRLHLRGLALEHHDGVARVHGRVAERRPVLGRVRGEQRQLGRAGGRGVAIERDARGVGAAVGHLAEHRAEVRAETLLDLRRLGEQSDYSAHG
jgi:hypothetical protein